MKLFKHRFQEPDRVGGAGGGAASGSDGTGTSSSGSAGSAAGSSSGSAASGGSAGAASAGASGAASGSSAASGASGQGSSGTASSGAAGASGTGGTGSSSSAGEAWDANWREKWSANDEKKLNWSKRYSTPGAMLDAAWNAQQKISSGELKAPLPKDATPEQLATYRKENGIPEKAEGYFEKLPQGVTLNDADRKMLAPYADIMHKHNLSPEAAGEFLAARAGVLDNLVSEQLANDKTLRVQVEDELRKEWGGEYRANVNNIQTLFQGAPEEVREAIMSARTMDGRAIFNDAKTMQFFAQLARQINPFGVIVNPDGGSMDQKGVDARISELEGPKFMGDKNSEYWKGPNADKIQKEYRDLVDARSRMKQRAA